MESDDKFVFTTDRKKSLPQGVSYPVSLKTISENLSSVPKVLEGRIHVVFTRSTSDASLVALATYNATWESWSLYIYAVKKDLLSTVKAFWSSQGFRLLKDWFASAKQSNSTRSELVFSLDGMQIISKTSSKR